MIVKTEGFVLKSRKYGESDSMLVIFSRKLGKINAIAKGAQKPKSALIAGVQPFCYSDFLLYRGKNLYTVTQCEPKEIFYKLREDVKRLSYASYLVELIEAVTIEGQTNNRMFNLLGKTLYLMTKSDIEINTIVRSFEMNFLNYCGFKPEFHCCVSCNKTTSASWKFSSQEGGLLCENCFSVDPYAMKISEITLRLAKYLQTKEITEIHKLKISDFLNEALKKLLKQYILVHINKYDFKSLELAEKL
ncbi:DNA repair protein RecO [Clostridium aceticum]|uniref:DNA repair protein RecO n=1 Tax=Clostridium aceticum TaxID=84022 RepID=A0A0D8I6J9_9CLOT|nr:DNA repair protein RecO [Clostridium aceticum]AKL95782.1 DNA repair protein RecO [Clostridium aceticum]KJF25672.1 DNA recombination protein RecO [Clostridium aceticum]